MVDMVITRSGELEVAQIEGQHYDAIEFIDAYMPTRDATAIQVVDSGCIIIPSRDLDEFVKRATLDGFKVEQEEGR